MIYREQGMSHALLTADLTTVPSSLVGAWTLIFGIESKFVRCYFSSLASKKNLIYRPGKIPTVKCLFCTREGFPIGTTGYALCPEDAKKVILCFSMRDQVMELYRTMELYSVIPKEAAPAGEAVVVKKRGRPPKRPEAVPTQAGAGEAAPEAPQPQGGAEPQG
jgi:hypothetical protein